jgi:hypothetical protein
MTRRLESLGSTFDTSCTNDLVTPELLRPHHSTTSQAYGTIEDEPSIPIR